MKHLSFLCQFRPFGSYYVTNDVTEWKYFLRQAPNGEEEEIFFTAREVVWSRANILKKKFQLHSDIVQVVWASFSKTNRNSDLCILHQGNLKRYCTREPICLLRAILTSNVYCTAD
jgi:hypothetical protein